MKKNKTIIPYKHNRRPIGDFSFSNQVSFIATGYYRQKYKNLRYKIRDIFHYREGGKRNIYGRMPAFYPGETVWVVVYNKDRTSVSIIKDKVIDVFSFGPTSLKEYYLEKTYFNTGIDANDIFKTKNEAMFYLCYGY